MADSTPILDVEAVRVRVERVAQHVSEGDMERASGQDMALCRDVLHAISTGETHDDPAALSAAALKGRWILHRAHLPPAMAAAAPAEFAVPRQTVASTLIDVIDDALEDVTRLVGAGNLARACWMEPSIYHMALDGMATGSASDDPAALAAEALKLGALLDQFCPDRSAKAAPARVASTAPRGTGTKALIGAAVLVVLVAAFPDHPGHGFVSDAISIAHTIAWVTALLIALTLAAHTDAARTLRQRATPPWRRSGAPRP